MEIKEALNVLKQVIDQSVAEGVFKHTDGVLVVHEAFKTVLSELNKVHNTPKETTKTAQTENPKMEVVIDN